MHRAAAELQLCAQKYARCRETVHKSPLISASLMLVGAVCFILLPGR